MEVGCCALNVDRVHIVTEHGHPGSPLDHHLLLHLGLAPAGARAVHAVQLLAPHPHDHCPGVVLVRRCRRAIGHALHVQRQLVIVVLRDPVAHRTPGSVRGREVFVTEQVVALGQLQQPLLDALHAGLVHAAVLAAVGVDLGDVVHHASNRRGSLGCPVLLGHGSPGSTVNTEYGTAVQRRSHRASRPALRARFDAHQQSVCLQNRGTHGKQEKRRPHTPPPERRR